MDAKLRSTLSVLWIFAVIDDGLLYCRRKVFIIAFNQFTIMVDIVAVVYRLGGMFLDDQA